MTKVIQFPSRDAGLLDTRRAPFPDFVRALLKRIHLPDNPRVLTFGREVGEAARMMAEHLQGHGQFLALHSATDYKSNARYAIEWRDWSPERLPLRGGEFDFVVGARGLMHLEHPPRIVREMARLLKRGAQLLLIEADLGGYIATANEEPEPNASVRLNPYIARELPALCREAGLQPTDLFPNFIVSPAPLTRGALKDKRVPLRTLRPRLVHLEQLEFNEYVRGMERIVRDQTGGQTATLLDVAVLAHKTLAPNS